MIVIVCSIDSSYSKMHSKSAAGTTSPRIESGMSVVMQWAWSSGSCDPDASVRRVCRSARDIVDAVGISSLTVTESSERRADALDSLISRVYGVGVLTVSADRRNLGMLNKALERRKSASRLSVRRLVVLSSDVEDADLMGSVVRRLDAHTIDVRGAFRTGSWLPSTTPLLRRLSIVNVSWEPRGPFPALETLEVSSSCVRLASVLTSISSDLVELVVKTSDLIPEEDDWRNAIVRRGYRRMKSLVIEAGCGSGGAMLQAGDVAGLLPQLPELVEVRLSGTGIGLMPASELRLIRPLRRMFILPALVWLADKGVIKVCDCRGSGPFAAWLLRSLVCGGIKVSKINLVLGSGCGGASTEALVDAVASLDHDVSVDLDLVASSRQRFLTETVQYALRALGPRIASLEFMTLPPGALARSVRPGGLPRLGTVSLHDAADTDDITALRDACFAGPSVASLRFSHTTRHGKLEQLSALRSLSKPRHHMTIMFSGAELDDRDVASLGLGTGVTLHRSGPRGPLYSNELVDHLPIFV